MSVHLTVYISYLTEAFNNSPVVVYSLKVIPIDWLMVKNALP